MAISYVGGATATSAGNTDVSVSLTALTGGSGSAPIQDDLVIFAYNIADNDNVDLNMTCNTAGFNEVADLLGNGTQDANLGVYYKFMTATPDTAVVGEGSLGGTDTAIQAAAMVFRGVKLAGAGGPFDVTSTTATGTTGGHANPPSIDTTGTAGIWTVIVGSNGHVQAANGTFSAPTNYTTDFLTVGNQDTNCGIIGMGYRTNPADPEDPGQMTSNQTATGWAAVTMALSEGAAVITGDLAATDAQDTTSFDGDVIVQGTMTPTEAQDTAALTGDVIVQGDMAPTEGADTTNITGDVVVQGDFAATEAQDTLAATGTVADPSITGDLAVTEDQDTASFTGDVFVAGTLSVTEVADVAALTGDVVVQGSLAATEALDVAALTGDVLIQGLLTVIEAQDTMAAVGTSGSGGGVVPVQQWSGRSGYGPRQGFAH